MYKDQKKKKTHTDFKDDQIFIISTKSYKKNDFNLRGFLKENPIMRPYLIRLVQ